MQHLNGNVALCEFSPELGLAQDSMARPAWDCIICFLYTLKLLVTLRAHPSPARDPPQTLAAWTAGIHLTSN